MDDNRSTGSIEDELKELQKNLSELMTSTTMLDKRVVESLNRKEVNRYQHWQQTHTNTEINQTSMPFEKENENVLTTDKPYKSSSFTGDKDDNKMELKDSNVMTDEVAIHSQYEQSETEPPSTTTDSADAHDDEEWRRERNNNRTMKCRLCLTKCTKVAATASDTCIEAGDSTYSEYEDDGRQPDSVEEIDDTQDIQEDRRQHDIMLNETTTAYRTIRESMFFVPKSLSETDIVVNLKHNVSEIVKSLSETNLMVVLKPANTLICDSPPSQDTIKTSTDHTEGAGQTQSEGPDVPRAPPRTPRRSPSRRRPALSPSRRQRLMKGADLILPCAPPTSCSWDRQADRWRTQSCDPDDALGGSASGEPGPLVAGSLVVECAHPPVVGVVYLKPPTETVETGDSMVSWEQEVS